MILLTLPFCAVVAVAAPCTESAQCADVMVHESGGNLRYFRSSPLEKNAAIERAIVIIQGNRRDADHYYDALVSAIEREPDAAVRLNETLLVAPHFRSIDDGPEPKELHWSSHGWKIGDKSRDTRRVSSFEALDALVTRMCGKAETLFPNLEKIVVIGHSAGGQFVNRYAAGGEECDKPGVETRYIIMNPSSYLYVDDRRDPDDTGTFARPNTSCSKFDEYKYGLRDLNRYMKRVGKKRLRSQLFERETHYVAGSKDERKGKSLDTRCQANLQGPNRLARHGIYRAYVALFEDWTGAKFHIVPDIGHRGARMLESSEVRALMLR